jgi:hypothetical protein
MLKKGTTMDALVEMIPSSKERAGFLVEAQGFEATLLDLAEHCRDLAEGLRASDARQGVEARRYDRMAAKLETAARAAKDLGL